MEKEGKKKEENKKEEREEERALNILFQSVSKKEENTRRDSIEGRPPTTHCCWRSSHWADTRDTYFPKHTDPAFAEM